MDIKQFLDQDEKKDLLRLLTAGSVDDGKSTMIGRLLFDSKKLYEDHLITLERDSKKVGHAGGEIDYALLLDGLKAEREQGITIDVAYRYFSTNKRKFIIADTPGHEQYTRNMVTGGSTANLAILLIDAKNGIITQTKRHTFLVSLLGIKHIFLAVNKMDLVDYKEERFEEICEEYKQFVTRLKLPDIHFFPISALKGDNIVNKSQNMKWYKGKSLLDMLETIHISSDRNFIDFRYPVQSVLRPSHTFRGFSGQIASGVVRKGDEIMVIPSKKKSKIASISTFNGELDYAFPPQSVTLTMEDEIDVSRGDMLVHPNNVPKIEQHFEAMLVWMDEKIMNPDGQFFLKHTSQVTRVRFDKIRYKIDVNNLHKHDGDKFKLNEIGRVVLTTARPIFFDAYEKNRNTGSFIIIDAITNNTSAVGMIIDRVSSENMPVKISDKTKRHISKSLITNEDRISKLNQNATTIWLTGLHGSGKTEILYFLEKILFDNGATVVVLDGSSVRSGLSRELGFNKSDRSEHLRRVAETAKILNDQGIIVLCNFISPEEDVRKQVREIIGENRFSLVYVDASLEWCKKQDSDGIYEKAINGKIKFFAGIDKEYEIPNDPDIHLLSEKKSLEKLANEIFHIIKGKIFG